MVANKISETVKNDFKSKFLFIVAEFFKLNVQRKEKLLNYCKEKEKALQNGIDEKEFALVEREEKLEEQEKKQQEKEKELADTEAQVKKQCEQVCLFQEQM